MKKYLGLLIYMLIGAVCGYLATVYVDIDLFIENPISSIIAALLGLYGGFILHIAVHELGHMIFGLLSGYTFNSYRIFNLMWIKENGKIKFKKYSLAGTAGQCLMNPPELVNDTIPYVLYNLGGILMNAIFIVLFFILYKVTTIYFVSCLSIVIAFIGVCIFLMNGLPFKVGGVATDGYNVLFLHKDKNAIKAFYQQMKIAQYMQEGYRLKDMPYDLFEIKENADLMNTLIVSIEVFRMNRLMDEHKFEEAYTSMKSLLDQETGLIGVHKNLLLVDCMYCEKLLYDKESVISKELNDFMKSMKENPSIIRIQYVLEKDFDKKNKILDHFEKVAKSYPYPSEIEQERELINLFRP